MGLESGLSLNGKSIDFALGELECRVMLEVCGSGFGLRLWVEECRKQ